jgi:hypothetical protein
VRWVSSCGNRLREDRVPVALLPDRPKSRPSGNRTSRPGQGSPFWKVLPISRWWERQREPDHGLQYPRIDSEGILVRKTGKSIFPPCRAPAAGS